MVADYDAVISEKKSIVFPRNSFHMCVVWTSSN